MNPVQRRTIAVAASTVAVAVAVAGTLAVRSAASGPAPARTVLVAARDLPPYRAIGAADLVPRAVPDGPAPGELSAVDQIRGRVPATTLRRGTPLREDQLVAVAAAAPAPREVTVDLVAPPGSAPPRPGERVDVLATSPAGAGRPAGTVPVLNGVTVVRTGRIPAVPGRPARYAITIVLTPRDEAGLLLARAAARLSLRPAAGSRPD